MKMLLILSIIICFILYVRCYTHKGNPSVFSNKNAIFKYVSASTTYNIDTLRCKFGGDLPTAINDMVEGFPVTELAIAYDNHTGKNCFFFKYRIITFVLFNK